MRRIAARALLSGTALLAACANVPSDEMARSPYVLPCAGATPPDQCLDASRAWSEGDHPRPNAPPSEGLSKALEDARVRRERSDDAR